MNIDPATLLNIQGNPTYEQLDNIEQFLAYCNEYAVQYDEPYVADAVYDRLKMILEEYRPESELLNQLWDDMNGMNTQTRDDYDYYLGMYPMESIQTIKDWNSNHMADFVDVVNRIGETNLTMSEKLNGHGIRIVYYEGQFIKATTRARSSAGRDITRQLSNIVPAGIDLPGLTEIRGELVLKNELLDEAKKYNPNIKNAFSAVSSMYRDSASVEENQLLDFVAYKLFNDTLELPTISSEYLHLEDYGFQTPTCVVFTVDPSEQDVEDVVQYVFENMEEEGSEYFLDGMVLSLDDKEETAAETDSNMVYRGGSLALKVGSFAQGIYTGIVREITFTPGRVKMSPVAILEDDTGESGVLTENGTTVTNVPLYEPVNILNLNALPGNPLSFKYGGEAGVVPCYPDGALLTDEAIRDIFGN